MADDPHPKGDYAEGQEHEGDKRERGRFSSGQAQKPGEKHPTGDFAEGQEHEGEKHREGDFAEGQEHDEKS